MQKLSTHIQRSSGRPDARVAPSATRTHRYRRPMDGRRQIRCRRVSPWRLEGRSYALVQPVQRIVVAKPGRKEQVHRQEHDHNEDGPLPGGFRNRTPEGERQRLTIGHGRNEIPSGDEQHEQQPAVSTLHVSPPNPIALRWVLRDRSRRIGDASVASRGTAVARRQPMPHSGRIPDPGAARQSHGLSTVLSSRLLRHGGDRR
ncbi:MAG: hypothetical protein QOF59_2644, partial [Actinomycetota bacterium]|nr:hypothetical protein [Actinomycetota bacterium]